MKQWKNSKEDLIFSLDIGTRTIIGIVGKYTEEEFNILAYSIKEHSKRNMYDGQIHDIDGVTEAVKEIKDELEGKLGTSLKKVSIAAAGRSLKTCKVRVDKEIGSNSEIRRNMVEVLELEAVQKAQEIINNDEEQNRLKYYNIGYTVISYYLDDNIMNKLEGHKGDKIGVKLLATFLPQMVIEGLYSVISKSGLEISNITLEPIAAINVAIKEELRLLNLALVDIGAGTSDIAITKDGKIMAYAMTSQAGDEITEALCKKYLLDFNDGENLKVKLNSQEVHEFADVVDIQHKLTTKEIVESIYETIESISSEIAEKIIEFNGKAPSAVFLIGGSSQMPGLKDCIAEKLGLPKERVSIRDTSFIENLEGMDPSINGPDIVTPIGIAVEGATQRYENFIQIRFNDEEVRIFNTEKAKVSDILVLTGYNPRYLIPKLGEHFIYFINGERKTIIGEEGNPAKIYVNNKTGNLNTILQDGDIVEIVKAAQGEKRTPYLSECIPVEKIVSCNNQNYNLVRDIRINGNKVEGNPQLREGDRIDIVEVKSVGEFLEFIDLKIPFTNILVNGQKANYNTLLKESDNITIIENRTIELVINGEEKVIEHNKDEFIFVDLFDYIDFDLSKPRGNLILKINNEVAEYMAPLKNGDKIEISWSK
ncbi:Actin-like ATPase involved in cell division [[Clostridium] ultunense Esp]|uniref:Chaperone protein DnaK n=1 Tax=[Clostridium] ultunense Esp TaxID=1288971 RepID=M1ZKD3_9FIRM|nr:cell division FtsA domain-containing protein [Schnuerera ultunensis]CCQ95252.1 Actin-like ATPase involved in cell division [[Clostridium] ultunense Esp]SHD75862.1 Actin-like ATPase involved in cell division [[Clostridium] ultunense Esp]